MQASARESKGRRQLPRKCTRGTIVCSQAHARSRHTTGPNQRSHRHTKRSWIQRHVIALHTRKSRASRSYGRGGQTLAVAGGLEDHSSRNPTLPRFGHVPKRTQTPRSQLSVCLQHDSVEPSNPQPGSRQGVAPPGDLERKVQAFIDGQEGKTTADKK